MQPADLRVSRADRTTVYQAKSPGSREAGAPAFLLGRKSADPHQGFPDSA